MNFLNKIEKFDNNPCIVDKRGKIFLYKDVLENAEKISKNLKEKKLILILANNNIEFITSYIGFFKKKLPQMLVDSQIEESLLNDLILTYKPTYILLPNSRKKNFKQYETFLELQDHKILKLYKKEIYSIDKNLALLLSTSGSTGSKKFVRISYENINDNTKNIVKYLKIKKNHKTITTMPPYYTYGLSIINTHLYSGASIVVTNTTVMEKLFWQVMKEQKIVSFGGVPYFYEILKKLNFNKIDLPSLKYFTQAGGPLNYETTKYFLKYCENNKKKLIIMYGQVEATSRMTYLPYNSLKTKIGSVGIPIPGGKILLKNKVLKKNSGSEIIYKGKNVSMGYANNFTDLNKKDLNKGVLKTGDLAKKDKDGYIFITGRKSRNVKLFGHRINLDEIEKILSKKGYKCLCYDTDNKITVFHTDNNYNENILKYLSKVTNIRLGCFRLKYIEKFPINEIGKISHKKLEKLL